MRRLALSLLPPFGLALLASLAIAAPKAEPKTTPTAVDTCPVPDAAMCLSKVKDGLTFTAYLETACGKHHKAVCRPFVRDAFQKDGDRAKARKAKVLDVDGKDIALDPTSDKDDLRDGFERRVYSKPKPGRALAVAGKSVLARSGLTTAPGDAAKSADAAAKPKHEKWEGNKQRIESCKEYAYEKIYDAMRFSDAAAKCAGDRRCEFEVAYMTKTPGIASRTLERKDGKPIPKQLGFKKQGKLPKNDMYTAAGYFAYSGDWTIDEPQNPDITMMGGGQPMKHTPELDALASSLGKGAKWYAFGCKGAECGGKKLADEWDFHRQLHSRNTAVSEAEFDEYARRKAEFRKLVDEYAASAEQGGKIWHCMMKPLECNRKADLVSRVKRFDMVTIDPFERMDLMQSAIDKTTVQAAAAAKAKLPTGAKLPSGMELPGGGAAQVHGASSFGKSRPAVGVLGSPVPAKTSPEVGKKKKPNVANLRCHPSHWEADYPGLPQKGGYHSGYLADLFGNGPAACRLGDFLREEYRRKQRGMKSCLDLDNDDCDWSTDMFHDRFVATFPYGQKLHEHETMCNTYTGGKIDVANLDKADEYIEKMRKLGAEATAKLKEYHEDDVKLNGKSMWKIGKTWDDTEGFGDKDWFAAGYDYSVGWSVRPADLASDKNKNICDLTGAAHANFNIDTWLLGNDLRVLEAMFRAKLNEDDNGKGHVKASVEILGDDVLDPPVDEEIDQTWDASGFNMVDLPEGWKPSFTFMAGPIPITGAVWGSLTYGANAGGSAKLKAANQCNPNAIRFDVTSRIEPFVGVNGFAQVGVGISGILSAGIRGSLNLVSLGLPLSAKLSAFEKTVEGQEQAFLKFSSSLALSLSTLSGYIALYVEFLFYTDEWELFRWSGLSTDIALMDPALEAELPMVVWP